MARQSENLKKKRIFYKNFCKKWKMKEFAKYPLCYTMIRSVEKGVYCALRGRPARRMPDGPAPQRSTDSQK